jgi:hypothetical protein
MSGFLTKLGIIHNLPYRPTKCDPLGLGLADSYLPTYLPTIPIYDLPKLFYNLLHTFYAMEWAGPRLLCTEELTARGRFLPMNPYLQPT